MDDDFISEVSVRCKLANSIIGLHPDGGKWLPEERDTLDKNFWDGFLPVKPKLVDEPSKIMCSRQVGDLVQSVKAMDNMDLIDNATNSWETALDMLKQLMDSVKRASADLKRVAAQRKRDEINEKKAAERDAEKKKTAAKSKTKAAAAKAGAAVASVVAAGGSVAGNINALAVFEKNDVQVMKVFEDAETLQGPDLQNDAT